MHRLACAVSVLFLFLPSAASAGEDYFMLMFGAQTVPSNPKYSHSFATFVRVCWVGDGPCPVNPTIETHTISWLPTTMNVRVCACCPECGTNFDLHTTIRWCQRNCMRVSMWGPYRICPDLFYMALKEEALLQSGQVRYKAIDMFYESDDVTNCIGAVDSVVRGANVEVPLPEWGEVASWQLLQECVPYIVSQAPVYWVGSAIGLDQYPIIYRDWQHPHSGLCAPIWRLFGSEACLRATCGPPARCCPATP